MKYKIAIVEKESGEISTGVYESNESPTIGDFVTNVEVLVENSGDTPDLQSGIVDEILE